MKHAITLSAVLLSAVSYPALAQIAPQQVSSPAIAAAPNLIAATASATQVFAPTPRLNTRLDYTAWDQLLKDMVLYSGPSLRKRAARPQATVGTRFVFGHTSPYRMEGNRIVFETMSDEYAAAISEFAREMVEIGNRLDMTALPKKEQLAYWLNLHNALAINAIVENYPLSSPLKIKGVDGLGFHDTIMATIDGVPLSLRTIREDIVYRHWDDPMVIYGFFHGDIGSPSIQRSAYTADTLHSTLKFSGTEFASSLRGFEIYGGKPRISKLYQDAAPYFFPNFETDVRAHLGRLMTDEAKASLNDAKGPFKIARYDTAIADLTAGDGDRESYSLVETLSDSGSRLTGGVMSRQLREYNQKFDEIRARGLFGRVTIEDIEPEESEQSPETSAPVE